MKALVTGANGFVGSHLCEHLLETGDDVRALVRKTSDRRWLPAVEEAIGDCGDRASLVTAMRDVDVVFHVAGCTKAVDRATFFAMNEGGTRNVLSAAARRPGTPPVVIAVSSLAAAGPSPDPHAPHDETAQPAPVSTYGRSKLAGERAARAWGGDLPLTIVRPPMVYGPRDKDVLEIFRLCSKFPHVVPQPGFGRKLFSAIHVRDLVRAIRILAMGGERCGAARPGDGPHPGRGTYFVDDGAPHGWDELVETAGAALGVRSRTVSVPVAATFFLGAFGELRQRLTGAPWIINLDKAREGRASHWICDASKARRLGCSPGFTLQSGFADTAAFYRRERWLA